MISSKTLKTFVKMHEYKLNAKINGRRAGHLESQIDSELHQGQQSMSGVAEHWDLAESDNSSRRRPKSRYFDFIMTATR